MGTRARVGHRTYSPVDGGDVPASQEPQVRGYGGCQSATGRLGNDWQSHSLPCDPSDVEIALRVIAQLGGVTLEEATRLLREEPNITRRVGGSAPRTSPTMIRSGAHCQNHI